LRIAQELPPFNPITFTLETREEADAFWGIVCAVEKECEDRAARDLCIKISDWFSNTAKL